MLGEVGYLSAHDRSFSRDYIWLGGKPIAQVERRQSKNGKKNVVSVSFIHSDHLNTPRMATDTKGKVVWRWESDAFGGNLKHNRKAIDMDPDRDGRKTKIRLRFPGQYADAESQLFYNHHRDYDPTLGRYIQSDPIGLLGGINNYIYTTSENV